MALNILGVRNSGAKRIVPLGGSTFAVTRLKCMVLADWPVLE
jgi:hypothetical protein